MRKTHIIVIVLVWLAYPLLGVDGILEYVDGTVDVVTAGDTIEADFGMEIFEGDVVRTGDDGTAIIGLSNGAKLKLRNGTILAMDMVGRKTSVMLRQGGVFSKVARRLGREFEVRTPSVAAGVRGTEFFVAYGKTIDETPDVWLCVNEGSVEVITDTSADSIIVEEGEGINIVAGLKLTAPRYFPWTRDLNWNMDPDEGEVTDVTDLNAAYSDLLNQDYD